MGGTRIERIPPDLLKRVGNAFTNYNFIDNYFTATSTNAGKKKLKPIPFNNYNELKSQAMVGDSSYNELKPQAIVGDSSYYTNGYSKF